MKTIAGFPILFLEIIMVIGFIKYMVKLRKESEISEKEVVNSIGKIKLEEVLTGDEETATNEID